MADAKPPEAADAIIIGGGFYGVCLALFLRSVYERVVLLEAEDTLLSRASLVNQARIHTGYHYPRSFVTARRSLALRHRFSTDFRAAVVDNFTMLYAIARHASKIAPQRFEYMFRDMGAPIARANGSQREIFDPKRIAAVFACEEYAFDAIALRDVLAARLEAAGIDLRLGTRAEHVAPDQSGTTITLASGAVRAPVVINATYGRFIPAADTAFAARLKYEMAEVALITPPAELAGLGITVMDGPFFSVMPFPARDCYSLTHVRYTPHYAWSGADPHRPPLSSNWMHMQRDSVRYMPCLAGLTWRESLFEVKTVLTRNEADDGRPIYLQRHPEAPGYMSVLGGKLDNIYDLFEVLNGLGGDLGGATDVLVSGRARHEGAA
ncbi:MAG: FAD-dependent oxidoreductase [Marinibacterium sp.]